MQMWPLSLLGPGRGMNAHTVMHLRNADSPARLVYGYAQGTQYGMKMLALLDFPGSPPSTS